MIETIQFVMNNYTIVNEEVLNENYFYFVIFSKIILVSPGYDT